MLDRKFHLTCIFNSTGMTKLRFTYDCFLYFFFNDLQFSVECLCFLVIILLIVFINLSVITCTLLNKDRKPIDLCFLSNSFSDLLMGLIVIPITGVYTLFGHFPFSSNICTIWTCIDFTIGTVSMLHITFISYDRYIAVSSPFEYKISLRKNSNKDLKLLNCRMPTYLILVFIWFLSILLWVPVILFLKTKTTIKLDYLKTVNSTKEEYSLSDCDVETIPWIIIPHSVIVYHLPIATIFLFYSKTINILNKKTLVKKRSTLTRKSPPPQIQSQQSGNNIQQKCFSNVFSTISSLSRRKENKDEVFELHSLKLNPNSINRKEKVSSKSDSDSFLKTKRSDTVKTKEVSLTSASSNSTYTTKKVSLNIHSYSLNESKQKHWHKSDSILENHAQKVKFEKLNSQSHLDLSLLNENKTAQKRRLSNLDCIELIKNDSKQTSVETRDNEEEKSSLFGCLFIQNKEKMRQEKRITYRLGFIMFTFIVSWAPFSVFWPLSSFCLNCKQFWKY